MTTTAQCALPATAVCNRPTLAQLHAEGHMGYPIHWHGGRPATPKYGDSVNVLAVEFMACRVEPRMSAIMPDWVTAFEVSDAVARAGFIHPVAEYDLGTRRLGVYLDNDTVVDCVLSVGCIHQHMGRVSLRSLVPTIRQMQQRGDVFVTVATPAE